MLTVLTERKPSTSAGGTLICPSFHDVNITFAAVRKLGGKGPTCYRRIRSNPFKVLGLSALWKPFRIVNNGITPHDFIHCPSSDPGDA